MNIDINQSLIITQTSLSMFIAVLILKNHLNGYISYLNQEIIVLLISCYTKWK